MHRLSDPYAATRSKRAEHFCSESVSQKMQKKNLCMVVKKKKKLRIFSSVFLILLNHPTVHSPMGHLSLKVAMSVCRVPVSRVSVQLFAFLKNTSYFSHLKKVESLITNCKKR